MSEELLRVRDPVRYVGPSELVYTLDDLRQVALEHGMTGYIVDRHRRRWVVRFTNAYTAAVTGCLEKSVH
jgi:hypothetical protein